MFALVDCNNFYVSCERVFQPQLEGKPVVVLSNNDGCCISRSEEAKKIGITMGAVYFLIEETIKKHHVIVRSSNYVLYDDMSRRVMTTLGRFVPEMEIYSIDEAFLNMHNLLFVDLMQLAIEIRSTIRQNTGIPVCIGIAPTKTLAKLANHYAKKMHPQTGVYMADTPEKIQVMMEWAELKEVWGIGRQYAKMLRSHGYQTVADLMAAPEDFIRQKMSVVGLRTLKELKGIPTIPWEFEVPPKEAICTSRCFGKLIEEKKIVAEAVAEYASNCAEKLRRQNSVTSVVNVFVHTNPHRNQDAQYNRSINVQLPLAASDTPAIVKAALWGLSAIWRDGYLYMKAGVMMMKLTPSDVVQGALFEPCNKEKQNAAMIALDKINRHFGRNTVKVAAMGQQREYKARAEHLSKCFTTRIEDVLQIWK